MELKFCWTTIYNSDKLIIFKGEIGGEIHVLMILFLFFVDEDEFQRLRGDEDQQSQEFKW